MVKPDRREHGNREQEHADLARRQVARVAALDEEERRIEVAPVDAKRVGHCGAAAAVASVCISVADPGSARLYCIARLRAASGCAASHSAMGRRAAAKPAIEYRIARRSRTPARRLMNQNSAR